MELPTSEFHKELFDDGKPTVEGWSKIRKVFGNNYYEEEPDDFEHTDKDKKHWFNYPVATLYVRNQGAHNEDDIKKWNDILKKAVPGNHNTNDNQRDFDHHQEGVCPENTGEEANDLFQNEKARSYESLLNPSEEELARVKESYENGESYDSDEEHPHDMGDMEGEEH